MEAIFNADFHLDAANEHGMEWLETLDRCQRLDRVNVRCRPVSYTSFPRATNAGAAITPVVQLWVGGECVHGNVLFLANVAQAARDGHSHKVAKGRSAKGRCSGKKRWIGESG